MKRCMWTAAVLIAAALLAPGILRGEGPVSPPDVVVGRSDEFPLSDTRDVVQRAKRLTTRLANTADPKLLAPPGATGHASVFLPGPCG